MITFSPGLAQGCFDLLGIVSRNSLTFQEIHTSFAFFGSIPAGKVVEVSQGLGWIRASDDGIAAVTAEGAKLLGISSYEAMLQQALLDYIDVVRPPWVQNAAFGRARVLSFAGSEIAQVFVEAGLAYGTGEGVVAFWDELSARARGQKDIRNTAIGRQGERLTLIHENKRTGRRPKWISIEDNADGYDILSVVSADDATQLSIEVKTSTMGIAGTLFLTRNEWDRAVETAHHVFHLWDTRAGAPPQLAIIEPKEMESHIPKDCGDGIWGQVSVPFAAFAGRFIAMQIAAPNSS